LKAKKAVAASVGLEGKLPLAVEQDGRRVGGGNPRRRHGEIGCRIQGENAGAGAGHVTSGPFVESTTDSTGCGLTGE